MYSKCQTRKILPANRNVTNRHQRLHLSIVGNKTSVGIFVIMNLHLQFLSGGFNDGDNINRPGGNYTGESDSDEVHRKK